MTQRGDAARQLAASAAQNLYESYNTGIFQPYSEMTDEFGSDEPVVDEDESLSAFDHMETAYSAIKEGDGDAAQQALHAAMQAYLDEAEKIAEEHGIPFSSGVSPLSQNYMTRSFPEKWDGVSSDVANSVIAMVARNTKSIRLLRLSSCVTVTANSSKADLTLPSCTDNASCAVTASSVSDP